MSKPRGLAGKLAPRYHQRCMEIQQDRMVRAAASGASWAHRAVRGETMVQGRAEAEVRRYLRRKKEMEKVRADLRESRKPQLVRQLGKIRRVRRMVLR